MFKKPVRVKSNNQVKGSERKGIKDLFSKNFPNIEESEVNSLLNNKKEPLNSIKIVTHDNKVIQVYSLQKQPMFFCIHDQLYPTVFLLWRYPNLIPNFTTHPQVLNFINSGADLMLPGVVTPPPQSGLPKYGNVSEGNTTYVNLSTNRAAIAVGVAAQSSFDMDRSAGKGKCVIVHHFYGDYLCTLEGSSIAPLPNLGPPEWLSFSSYDSDFPELGGSNKNDLSAARLEENVLDTVVDKPDLRVLESCNKEDSSNLQTNETSDLNVETSDVQVDEILINETEEMDNMLKYCFLASIKYSKTLVLPVLISNFFKLQMLPMCPEGQSLDIKKTSYKKLKPFLDEMCKMGLITIKEIKKGVEAITDINKEHPKFNEFYLKPEDRPKKESENPADSRKTQVMESYIITQNVIPIFQPGGYHKGDIIDGPNIRKFVTDYVRNNNCQDPENPKLVKPNTDALKTIFKTPNSVTWEETFEKVCEAMKNCFKISSGAEEIVNKGKVSPITMTVKMRSGNKKVTIVDNLEVFGINLNEFSKECQHGVAASTSILPKPPGKRCDQLLVQGNQILFVYNLLSDKYKVPKKYIQGLENAPKKKK